MVASDTSVLLFTVGLLLFAVGSFDGRFKDGSLGSFIFSTVGMLGAGVLALGFGLMFINYLVVEWPNRAAWWFMP